jgi:hypothetical protein
MPFKPPALRGGGPDPEQFHFEIALATAHAGARREGVSAIYLRCQAPEQAQARAEMAYNFKGKRSTYYA